MFEDPKYEAKPKPQKTQYTFQGDLPKKEELPQQVSGEERNLPGFHREEYERFFPTTTISPLTRDLDYERAISQSTGEQLASGLGRGLINIIPSVIENVASILDFEDYYNQDLEIGNAISDAMEEFRTEVKGLMPIYRENPNKPLDIGDPAWWAENGSSLIESIGGFAITGGGLGLLLGGLAKIGQLGNAAAVLLSSVALNQAESVQSAASVFNQIFNDNLENGYADAAEKASKAASTVVNINRANILLNLTSANLFMKTPLGTRVKLKTPSTGKEILRGLGEGVQEYGEETINYLAEQAGLDPGMNFEDVVDNIMSAEGVEAGILGFVGGFGQTAGTHLVNRLTGKTKDERERYLNQLNEISKINAMLVERDLPSISTAFMDIQQLTELSNEIVDAQNKGDLEKEESLRSKVVEFQAYKAFQNGTTEDLINFYNKTKELSPEEATDKQLIADEKSPDYYVNRADQAIKKIEKLENIYNTLNLRKYLNGAEILGNRSEVLAIEDQIKEIDNQIVKIQTVLPEAELSSKETAQLESIKEILNNRKKRLTEEYKKITSKDYQDALIKRVEEKAKAQQEVKREAAKQTIKENPAKVNEVIDGGLFDPAEAEALKQSAAEAAKETRTGKIDDNTLFGDEPVTEATYDDSITEEETTEVGPVTYDDSIVEEEVDELPKGFVDTSKEEIGEDPLKKKKYQKEPKFSILGEETFGEDPRKTNSLVNRELFGINKITKEDSFIAKRNKIEASNYSKDIKDKLLKALDDRYYSLRGLHLVPVNSQEIEEIETDKSTDRSSTQPIDRDKDTKEINNKLHSESKKKNYHDSGLTSLAYRVEEEDGTIIEAYKDLLHPNKFQAGTKLTLRVADDPNVIISKDLTWGTIKPQLKNPDDIIGRMPIQVLHEGKVIGYLHDLAWNPKYYDNAKQLAEDKISLFELRKSIIDQKEDSNIQDKKADIERRKQELESSREIEILYDLTKPIVEDSKEIISKIEKANKLRKEAAVKSEQAVKETNEERKIALNSEADSLYEKVIILDKEVKISRDSVINNTPIKQAITSAKFLGQRLLNKIKLAAKSNEWVSSMLISKEEFTKLEDATKRLSVKGMGEVTSNSEVIPDILLIEEINAKYDAELATLETPSKSIKELEVTVKQKTNGVYRVSPNLKTLKELPNDPNLQIHISTQKGLVNPITDKLASNSPLHENKFGHTFISFIVGDNTRMLYDTFDSRIGDTGLEEVIYNTVDKTVTIFHKVSSGQKLSEEEVQIINDIKNTSKFGEFQGYDIRSLEDLREYLGQFIQFAEVRASEKEDLKKFAQRYKTPDLNLITLTKEGFEVLSRVKGTEFSYFSRWNVVDKVNEDYFKKNLGLLKRNLKNYYTHTSTNALQANQPLSGVVGNKVETIYKTYNDYLKDTLRVNLNPIQIDENTVSYMVQNRIYLDTKVEKRETPIKTTVPIVEETSTTSEEEYEHNYDVEEDDEVQDFVIGDLTNVRENTKNLLVRELGGRRQEEFIHHIVSLAVARVTENRTINLTEVSDPLFEKIKKDNIKAKGNVTRISKLTPEEQTSKNLNKHKRIVKLTQTLLDNKDSLLNLAKYSLDRITLVRLDEDSDMQDGDDNREGKDTWDKNSAEVDTKDKVSKELKLFFSGIHEYNRDGKVVKNFLGEDKLMRWEDVFNNLQVLTANLQPDFNIINEELALYSTQQPYLKEAIDKLNAAPLNIRNQFVEIMSNHANHMEYAAWEKDSAGNIKYVIQPSNINNVQTIITQRWFNQFKGSPIITQDAEGNDVFDQKRVEEFLAGYENLKKTPTIKNFGDWLNLIGIDLGDVTLKAINDGLYINSKKRNIKLNSLIRNDVGYVLFKNIERLKTSEITDEVNPFSDNIIKELAKFEAQYVPTSLSNSHRSGTKQVYSYNQNKFLTNNIIDIKSLNEHKVGDVSVYTSPILTQKVLTPFSSKSLWLNNMIEHNEDGTVKMFNGEVVVNPDNKHFINFNYWTSDLEGIKQLGKPSRDNREMSKLPDVEIERIKLARMQASFINFSSEKLTNKEKIGETTYLTTSDKPTVIGLKTILPTISLEDNGLPSKETYELLYSQLVLPEILRMFQYKKHKLQNVDYNDKNYEAGAKLFLIIPELNNIPGIFDTNGYISDNAQTSDMKLSIMDELKKHFETLVERKLRFWEDVGIGIDIKDSKDKVKYRRAFLDNQFLNNVITSTDKITGAATYMVAQTLISNSNVTMLFSGDPALYYDAKKTERMTTEQAVRYTYTNLGKRLAADVGPKTSNQDSLNSTTTEVVINDRDMRSLNFNKYLQILDGISLDQYNKLSKKEKKRLNASKYDGITGTDAQEWTTLKEHLRLLNDRGKLSPDLYPNALKIINRELENENYSYDNIVERELENIREGLGREYRQASITPVKPQYTYNVFDSRLNIEKRIFVKSSSFPLTESLTKGMDIDGVRIAMESQEIDRLGFKSAVKVGSPTTSTSLWKEDGTIKEIPDVEVRMAYEFFRKNPDYKEKTKEFEDKYILFHDDNILKLPRRGFGIQQETPYDPYHDTINRVTQAHKNLFVDLLDVEGFEYDGKILKGNELESIYLDKFNSLFKLLRKDLLDELEVDENFDVKDLDGFITNVKKVIKKEMLQRGYPLSDIEFLDLEKSLDMIAFLPSGEKIEALLNSIVRNRILKMKFPGYSFIVGSEEGFQKVKEYKGQTGIVFTDKFTGTLQENQVIIPFTFKDNKGNLLNLEDYTTDGKLDTTKFPSELLEMLAMRIPNSSQSLQATVEVVGFLPVQTDLIIATRDFIAKMGQDFDVDKLYIYKTGTKFVDGKIVRDTEGKIGLMNDIVDIMKSVHKNPNALEKTLNPIGEWKLQEIADNVEQINALKDTFFSGLSDEYQTKKFVQASAAKSAVGIYASLSIFNAIAQNKGLVIMNPETLSPLQVRYGNSVSNGNISEQKTFSGVNKSLVIEGTLSGALDNEKLQILDKLNLNQDTIPVTNLNILLGFDEEAFYLNVQQSIIDFVNLKNKYKAIGEFKRESEILNELIDNYSKLDSTLQNFQIEDLRDMADSLGAKDLEEMLYKGDTYKDFYKLQIGLLNKFIELTDHASALRTPMKLLSVDSQGFGKSLIESNEFQYSLNQLSGRIIGVERLFGKFSEEGVFLEPTTIPGMSLFYGLQTNTKLWNRFFPYNSTSFRVVRDHALRNLKGFDSVQSNADNTKLVWESMKSYLYSKQNLGLLNNETIDQFRQRAFYGENSLAKIVLKAKRTLRNDFLNALEVDIQTGKKPSTINYRASTKAGDNELRLYTSFLDLLEKKNLGENNTPLMINGKEYSSQDLYHDLVTAFYITGGNQKANQYGKYISPSYLYSIPFGRELIKRSTIDNLGIRESDNPHYLHPFEVQMYQHTADALSFKYGKDDLIKLKDGVTLKETIVKQFEDPATLPTVFSVYDYKASAGNNKWVPYILTRFENNIPVYKEMNSLGTRDFDEYNAEATNIISSLLAQKPISFELNAAPKVSTPMENVSTKSSFENIGVTEAEGIEESNEVIKEVLSNIIQDHANGFYAELAKWMYEINFNIKNIKIINKDSNLAAQYNNKEKRLTFFNPTAEISKLQDSFLHELVHSINLDAYNDPKNKTIVAHIETIMRDLRSDIEKGNYPQITEDYFLMRKYYLQSLVNESKDKVSIQEYRKEIYQIDKKLGVLAKEDIISYVQGDKPRFNKIKPIMYGLTNGREFVQAVIKDKEFQEFLNQIPSKNPIKKTIFHEMIDLLLQMIDNFIGVKKGSVLEEALESSLKLIQIYPENFQGTPNDEAPFDISIGIPTVQETLQKFGELNPDGTKKKLSNVVNGDKNYRLMLGRAIKINQGQKFYKASVIKTLVNNKEFWTISLQNRENILTFEDRYNAITKDVVDKYIKNCR